jgi:hypothetical protein
MVLRRDDTRHYAPVLDGGVETCTAPFLYFIASRALAEADAATLLEWLETDAKWSRHRGPFFDQYECNLLASEPPPVLAGVLADSARDAMRRRAEEIFGAELDRRVTVTAHKLVTGQGIGIHTDEPHADTETHRVVVHLGREFEDRLGGHLLFFSSEDPSDLHRIFRPLHNTAVGLAMSDRSFHAVNDVAEGERYTVVFSFWAADRPPRPQDEWHDEERERLERFVAFLEDSGAAELHHSHADLLAHLIGTHGQLQRWGCTDELCIAGLFHSVYGTQHFAGARGRAPDRDRLKQLIGERTERLVWLYCRADRRSLYANLSADAPYAITDFETGERHALTTAELSDLMTLDLANSLEQLPRIPIEAELLAEESAIYERAARLLPPPALREMRRSYWRG